ncbi:MAG: hypothetical protein ACI9EF_001044 [Pseudohongiellaceae bacterium]|jgi:hypothetical protein
MTKPSKPAGRDSQATFRIWLCAALLAMVPWASAAEDKATLVDASLTVDGKVLSAIAQDVDGDGRQDITSAIYNAALSRREIRVWRFKDNGQRESAPFVTVPILDDVVAWCWADVRDEPGKELVFLSRTGAWSYSITLDGYRNNIQRLVDVELLYDVPDPTSLPHWDYVLSCPEGDQLLLPELGGYSIWAPSEKVADNEPQSMTRFSQFRVSPRLVQTVPSDRRKIQISSAGVAVSGGSSGNPLIDLNSEQQIGPLVDAGSRMRAPAMVDANGDGRDDLIRLGEDELHLHLATDKGISNQVSRSEPFPPYLRGLDDETEIDFEFLDLDQDGDVDVLARLRAARGSSLDGNRQVSFLLLLNDGRLLPERPQQILKFEAAAVKPSLTDVDGDGRTDLVFDKITAPRLLDITSPDGLAVTRSMLVFLGKDDELFERHPILDQLKIFDETSLGDAVTRQAIGPDCNGDGIGDLVEINLAGEVRIHTIAKESSFFGGDTWTINRTPWRRFHSGADLKNFRNDDINGDGLADVLSFQGPQLTLLLSQRLGDAQ